jgi:hypothetical protein
MRGRAEKHALLSETPSYKRFAQTLSWPVRHPDADSSGGHARKRSVASPRCARRIRNGSISPRPGRANLPCSAVSDYTCRRGDCANCCRNFARIVTSRRSSLSSRRSGLAAWSEESVSLVAGEMQDQGWRSGSSDQEAVSGSNSGLSPEPARVAAFFVGCANRLIIREPVGGRRLMLRLQVLRPCNCIGKDLEASDIRSYSAGPTEPRFAAYAYSPVPL